MDKNMTLCLLEAKIHQLIGVKQALKTRNRLMQYLLKCYGLLLFINSSFYSVIHLPT